MPSSSQSTSLVLFRGFGSKKQICVSGQVVLGQRVPREPEPEEQGRWGRFKFRAHQALRLLFSQRVPRTRLQIRWGNDHEAALMTDSHGYFFSCLTPGSNGGETPWDSYEAELVEPPPPEPVSNQAKVLTTSAYTQRAIVSDIDDTVIYTGVANKLAMLWRLFVLGADQRTPFPGIAPLYQGLHRGSGEQHEHNPMIYLSRSPWSLYPTLEELYQIHGIPEGPVLLLRDWGITLRHPFPRQAPDHKRDMLARISQVYPNLPLVLIGDSGQHDPELYAAFARTNSRQVAAICIREINPAPARQRELRRLRAEIEALGVAWVCARNSLELASFMSERGWIAQEDLARVRERFREDRI